MASPASKLSGQLQVGLNHVYMIHHFLCCHFKREKMHGKTSCGLTDATAAPSGGWGVEAARHWAVC